MPDHLLDQIARTLAQPVPRRQAVKLVVGGVAAAALAFLGGKEVMAAQAPKPKPPPPPPPCPKGSSGPCGTAGLCCATGTNCLPNLNGGTCCPAAQTCGGGDTAQCCTTDQICSSGQPSDNDKDDVGQYCTTPPISPGTKPKPKPKPKP